VRRQTQVALFWLGGLVLVIAAVFLFRPILLPFIAGMALAYALDPLTDWLQRRGLSRTVATFVVMVLVVLAFAAIFVLIVPILVNQLVGFVQGLPGYIERLQTLLVPLLDSQWARYLGIDADTLRKSLSGFLTSGADLVQTLVSSVLTGGRTIVDVASLVVVTPFVVFYVLRDWHKMVAWLDGLLPRNHADEIRTLARAMDAKVAAFVRGQMLSGLVLGIFYASGLVLIGLNYGLLIGLAAGILSFIPYVGFTAGFVVSIAIALVQFWPDWIWLAATIGVFMVGQVLEGYILQPYLIGARVGLHPVWLLFSLFAFGLLFGFIGLLIAIPAAAAVGVLLHFAVQRYQESSLFRGTGGSAGND
jgi:predicted PurR-regulated permease PerM